MHWPLPTFITLIVPGSARMLRSVSQKTPHSSTAHIADGISTLSFLYLRRIKYAVNSRYETMSHGAARLFSI